MLGGVLGGLANLGTAYGRGYLPAQNLYNQNQLQQLQLQTLLQNQQAQQNLVPFYANNPQLFPTTPQPQPGTATPGAVPTPGPLQPLTTAPVTPVQAQPLPPQLPQVPSYATAFDTAAPQLGGLGGGTPSVGGMGGGTLAGSPFGPGQPFTGTTGGAGTGISPLAGFGTGLPSPRGELAGDPSLGLGKDLPLVDVPGAAPPQQVSYGGLGPGPDQTTAFMGTGTLGQPTLNGYGVGGRAPQPPTGPAQPPAGALDFGPQIAALRAPAMQGPTRPQVPAAEREAPDLAGRQNLLPQYDALGTTRPLGPGEYVMNSDGSWSSEYTVTVQDPRQAGRYMVVPSLWLRNGKPTILSEDEAAEAAVNSGLNFPTFGSEPAAEAFSNRRESTWQQTPVGRSDMQPALWSQPSGATVQTQWGGQPQPQPGTFRMSPAPVREPGTQDPSYGMTVRGSWFGNSPGWRDPSDTGTQASGVPVAGNPGIALPTRNTLGRMFDVTTPDGRTFRLLQTDTGPDPRTGRGVDINSAAAEQMGYTPGNFPTDGQFTVRPASGGYFPSVHREMSSDLSPEQHGIGDRGLQMILARMPQLPQAMPYMNPSQVAQLIQQQFPGTSDAVKGAMFVKILPMMNDYAKEQTAVAWRNWQGQMEQLEDVMKWRHEAATEDKERFGQPENFIDTATGQPVLGRAVQMSGGRVGVVDAGGQMLDASRLRKPFPGEETVPKFGTIEDLLAKWRTEFVAQTGRQPTTEETAKKRSEFAGEVKPEAKGVLTEAQAEYWAKVISQGGALPPGVARDKATIQQIMRHTGETGDPGDFILKHGEVKADTTSLNQMQKMTDAVESFSKTANANLDTALRLSKGAVPTNLGPLFNRWVETGQTTFGDVQVPAYQAALLSAANEVAKVLSGSTGAAGATVSGREEAERILSPYLATGQIEAAANVLKQEMRNRIGNLHDQLNAIKSRLRGGGTTAEPSRAEPTGGAGTTTSGGETPDTAIATMNEEQLLQYLAREDITDEQRYQANQAYNRIRAKQRQGADSSTLAPPMAR